MGALGYNYTLYLFSDKCAVKKVYTGSGKPICCCVCHKEIKTKTCFEIDECFCDCFGWKTTKEDWDKAYCPACVKKLTIGKEVTST